MHTWAQLLVGIFVKVVGKGRILFKGTTAQQNKLVLADEMALLSESLYSRLKSVIPKN